MESNNTVTTCFNCKTDGAPIYQTKRLKTYKIRPGIPMRKLEERIPGKFGGKGKLIREGYVCDLCYRRLGKTNLPPKLEPQGPIDPDSLSSS